MLKLLGEVLILVLTTILSDRIDTLLVQTIFYRSRKRRQETVFEHIKKRKHISTKLLNLFCDRRNHKLQQFAERRISKHLDIVRFLKNQMVSKIIQRLLFSKPERFLLRNQATPFVVKSAKNKNLNEFTSSEDQDFFPTGENSQYYDRLVDGVYESELPRPDRVSLKNVVSNQRLET